MPGKRPQPLSRSEIADTAIRIIGERGISSLTTAVLAQELGVSSGAPFRHFASWDEILEAVADRVVESIGGVFPDPTLPPLERLSGLFLARTEAVSKHMGVARLIFSDQFSKALPEKAAATIRGLVKRTRAYILDALQEAAREGQIRTDVSPEDLLVLVMGTLQHLAFLSAIRPKGAARSFEPQRVMDTLLVLLKPTV